MTSSTTIKAASTNGGTTTKPAPAQREHGISRIREEECYHLTSLIQNCLDEAEHLVRKVHDKAYNRVVDYDGVKGAQPLDRAEAKQILDEAYECASLALTYLFNVSTHLDEAPQEPPF
jgi:hypothetical protein